MKDQVEALIQFRPESVYPGGGGVLDPSLGIGVPPRV